MYLLVIFTITVGFQIGSSTEYQTAPLKEISTIAVSPISAKKPVQHSKSSKEYPRTTVKKYSATTDSSTVSTANTLISQGKTDKINSIKWDHTTMYSALQKFLNKMKIFSNNY